MFRKDSAVIAFITLSVCISTSTTINFLCNDMSGKKRLVFYACNSGCSVTLRNLGAVPLIACVRVPSSVFFLQQYALSCSRIQNFESMQGIDLIKAQGKPARCGSSSLVPVHFENRAIVFSSSFEIDLRGYSSPCRRRTATAKTISIMSLRSVLIRHTCN